ncbi:hypothetical protein BgiMline_030315 [Biomphalaria glabrata]|nr:hypothetical protein BgiMline_032865 [Biomphalaria glabrata]
MSSMLQDVILQNVTTTQRLLDVIVENVTTSPKYHRMKTTPLLQDVIMKIALKNVATEPRCSSEKCHHCS